MSMSEDDDVAMPLPSFAGAANSQQSTASSNRNEYLMSPARSSGSTLGALKNALGTPQSRPREVHSAFGKKLLVWPMTQDVRDCNDVIHRDISIPPAVQVVLDSPPVQRLVNLKQLGCAYNAYPCCTHTRKEHSLGVMELAGRLATNIRQKQPQLNISDKDILCLRIAGLCHDLGHGPFSHTYEAFLKASCKNEREHPEQYEERNRKFEEQYGVKLPPLPEKYEHELTSCMMIDFLLSSVGLEIDWANLDEPLKQIAVGIDAEKFGLVNGSGDDKSYEPLTSRDFVFIKECIYGSPLSDPHAPTTQKTFVGREMDKEFLYDVVNNRHNGLDTDKIDYYDRDSLAANGCKQGNLNIFLRDACVAWGEYSNPQMYFQCKDKNDLGRHLMICYPSKHTSSAMNFFATRMKNHETIYTHKKTKAAELQMVDLLLEADKHFSMLFSTQLYDPHGIPVPTRFYGFKFQQLPISRAWMFPRLFLRMDDTITSVIESKAVENPLPQLGRLRELLNDRRKHKFYKCVAEVEIGTLGGDELWEMSEDEINEEFLAQQPRHLDSDGKVVRLEADDFIVEKRTLHYGRKEKNPVSQMRFLKNKSDQAKLSNPIPKLPIAEEVENLPMNTPSSFLRRTIRFFCCTANQYELISHTFESWKEHKTQQAENPNCVFEVLNGNEVEVDDDDEEEETPHLNSQPVTQDDDFELLLSPRKRKGSEDSNTKPAKKRLSYN
mmetsp:Transcript_5771/g.12613  ORF Transcript_5771/g.12613 Transcript_5771/m.12613 type:complete len:721 (+) Transcript_5771:101-2263(+)